MTGKLQNHEEILLNLSSNRSNLESDEKSKTVNSWKGETFNPKTNVSPKTKKVIMNITPKKVSSNNLGILSTKNIPSPLQTVINGQKSPLRSNNQANISLNNQTINNGPKSPRPGNKNSNFSPNSHSLSFIPTRRDQSINFSGVTESPSKLNTSSFKNNGIPSSSRVMDTSNVQVSFFYF